MKAEAMKSWSGGVFFFVFFGARPLRAPEIL